MTKWHFFIFALKILQLQDNYIHNETYLSLSLKETEPCLNLNGGVMASVLASSTVDSGFELRWGQTKDYTIGI